MGAGGYGAAGLSVRAGMGISELAGARGKRAERSRAKGRAAAKGLHEKIPTEGAEIIPRYQNKAPWPRGDAPPAPEHGGADRCPFPSPSGVPGRLAAGWHRSPSLGRVLPGCTCRSLPGTWLPAGFPKWDVTGPAPRCREKLPAPGEGDRDGAPGVSQAHETRSLIPYLLLPRPGIPWHWGVAVALSSAPSLDPLPESSGFL